MVPKNSKMGILKFFLALEDGANKKIHLVVSSSSTHRVPFNTKRELKSRMESLNVNLQNYN